MIKQTMQLLLCLACLSSFSSMLASTFGIFSHGVDYLRDVSNRNSVATAILYPYLYVLSTYLQIIPKLERWRSLFGVLFGSGLIPIVLFAAVHTI